ncbi:MAG: hypothetical protein HDR28_05435 [Lachnospiraceae bacterium]|nr:hypothetical protein [Lachnospiraceae bacterium]
MEKLYPIFPYGKVEKGSRCFFYGGGRVGKTLLKQVLKSGFCQVLGFIDQNADRYKQDGILYIYPEEIKAYEYDYIIVTVLKSREINERLEQMGIADEKIITLDNSNYYSKSEYTEIFQNVEVGSYYLPKYLRLKDINLAQETLSQIIDSKPVTFCMEQVILSNEEFDDVLVKSLKCQTSVFWLVNEEGKYLGAIDLGSDDIALSRYKKGILIKDMIASADTGSVYLADTLKAALKKISRIETCNIAVVDENHRLVKVMDRLSFYNVIADVRAKENELLMDSSVFRKRCKNSPELGKYAYSKYSQNGEDGIIEEIFKRIGFQSKYAVEFGGWDGIFLSNIRNLVLEHDFRALFIEGEEEKAAEGIENYKAMSERVSFVTGYVQHRKEKTLDSFLKENNAPIDIDLLSIDVDGCDYHVWKSLLNYRPRCVVIEYNPTVPNHILMVPPLNEGRQTGASPRALVELGMGKGYSLAAVTDCNLIFVVNEEFEKLGIGNHSLDTLRPWDLQANNSWFMTFEGEIYNAGPGDNYIWQGGKKFSSDKFVVL